MLFKDIIGQEKIKNKLIQTVRDNRVSHAQLFLGPEGSGKFALAIAYAQYICCTKKQNQDACGACPSCVKFNNLAHPDLHFIFPVNTTKDHKDKVQSKDLIKNWREFILENNYFPALNTWYEKIGIENKQGIINKHDGNEIIKTLGYKSYESEYKIMIIWMVEKIYHAVAPKILKILEEPPDKTLFILIAENQDQIINTILSRTQIIKIPKLDEKSILKATIKITNCTEKDAKNAANIANGNLITSLKYIQQSESDKFNFESFRKWMRLCFKDNIIEINTFINDMAKKNREELKSFLAYASKVTRNCLLMNYGDASLVKLNDEERTFVNDFSPFINSANARQFTEAFNNAYLYIERNAFPSIVLMDLSLKSIRLLKLKAVDSFV